MLMALACGPSYGAADLPKITIIIDDLGYAYGAGQRAIALPGPIVCAVLPETPRGTSLAKLAHASGKEVLLHLPLQSVDNDDALQPEPGLLTIDMGQRWFRDTLKAHLSDVPNAIGINGHRGSLLTRHPGHMAWLMTELEAEALLFVDSRTTPESVALDIAREFRIPSTRRDVFLDDDPSLAAIADEFRRLKRLAQMRGSAVGIGHPYPTTLEFLERSLPKLAADGFELVGIRALIEHQGATGVSRGAGSRRLSP